MENVCLGICVDHPGNPGRYATILLSAYQEDCLSWDDYFITIALVGLCAVTLLCKTVTYKSTFSQGLYHRYGNLYIRW